MRILLVEDDESIREVFKLYLETETPFDGLSVDVACNGTQAIKQIGAVKPDLVLLDLTLPGQHGFEVFKKIQALEGCQALPVVAVTAHNHAELKKQALDLGFFGYILKPIDFDAELIPLLKDFSEKHSKSSVA
ncbi:MAG: response regulator [Bdellovibrionota bacterium]